MRVNQSRNDCNVLYLSTVPRPKGLTICLKTAARDHGAMTKAENRAAAKAYHRQKMREMAQAIRKDRVDADLVELDRLRRYLIFKSESGEPRETLLSAIDDYVEALTGDRRALHGQNSSIG
jgi:hypothetical protein